MKPAHIDTDGPVWSFTPPKHKTAHKGKHRKILIGPKAQVILRPYLNRPENSFCFSAREQWEKSIEKRIASGTIHRKVLRGINDDRPRAPRDRYSTDSVRRAVHRACDIAFPAPEEFDNDQVAQWQRAHRWSPHQLRHMAATEARRVGGLDCAQLLLGHSDQRVTQRYAEIDLTLAENFVMQFG